MLNHTAVRASLSAVGLMVFLAAGDTAFAEKPKVLFVQQDKIISFNLTAPVTDQPLGGAVGGSVGTAQGAINGTSTINFKFTFTSNPFALPVNFSFENRVGITDTDGDQIIFRNVGTGRFSIPLSDPTVGGNPGNSPFQVFGNGAGGPLTGTYEVVATSGKYLALYPLGTVFDSRAVSVNPPTPPNPAGTTGSSYTEVSGIK